MEEDAIRTWVIMTLVTVAIIAFASCAEDIFDELAMETLYTEDDGETQEYTKERRERPHVHQPPGPASEGFGGGRVQVAPGQAARSQQAERKYRKPCRKKSSIAEQSAVSSTSTIADCSTKSTEEDSLLTTASHSVICPK
ncbi:uncharacterized protein LOC135383386 [Ornithodoros turicata]|uniref:uncharacterized protein LOC135383386 n=1 Tax=Ornithodoros turicata TaxID=34597 RepID=UPI0031386A03